MVNDSLQGYEFCVLGVLRKCVSRFLFTAWHHSVKVRLPPDTLLWRVVASTSSCSFHRHFTVCNLPLRLSSV